MSNLTGRPVYQKGTPRKQRMDKRPNAEEKRLWAKVKQLDCAIGPIGCWGRKTIHHLFTGAGGRKDHKKVCCLCWGHHLGVEGIDGKSMSKMQWQAKYEAEQSIYERTMEAVAKL